MPKVLELQGFKFFFYSDEGNEPAHVHIKKGEARGKWWLEPELEEAYAYGFTLQERRQVRNIINEHSESLKQQWHEYFKR